MSITLLVPFSNIFSITYVVVAECEDHARITTVYIPENNKWIDYVFRRDQR
jgi:hypothetical protein